MTSTPRAEVDFYSVLNVPRDANEEEIRVAYKGLTRRMHPDMHSSDPALAAMASELFPLIHEAYDVLTNPAKRSLYDQYGVEGLKWQITAATPEEARRKYEDLKRKLEESERGVRLKSMLSATSDISAAVRPLRAGNFAELRDVLAPGKGGNHGGGKRMALSEFTVLQHLQAHLNDTDVVTVQGIAQVRGSDGRGADALLVALTRKLGAVGDVTASYQLHFAGHHTARLALSHPLTFAAAETSVTAALAVAPNGGSLQTSVTRRLSERVTGSLAVTVGATRDFGVSLDYKGDSTEIRPSFQLQPSDEGAPNAALTYKKHLDKRSRLVVDLGYQMPQGGAPGAAQVAVGVSRALAKQHKLGLHLRYAAAGAAIEVRYNYAGHEMVFPFLLSRGTADYSLPFAIGHALVSGAISLAAKRLLFDVIERKKRQRKLERLRREHAAHIAESKVKAAAACKLLQPTADKKRRAEENRRGLVIIRARYGVLSGEGAVAAATDAATTTTTTSTSTAATATSDPAWIDVTVPLQSLVENSMLRLQRGAKNDLLGFYDPRMGEDKRLEVQYLFHNVPHRVEMDEKAELRIPLESHRVPT